MVRLPAEYQEVEYLEGTGEQYIDTGVTVANRMEIVAEFRIEAVNGKGSGWLFGSSQRNSPYQWFAIYAGSNSYQNDITMQYIDTSNAVNYVRLTDSNLYNDGIKHIVSVSKNGTSLHIDVDGTYSGDAVSANYTQQIPIGLFARIDYANGTGGEINKRNCKIYSFKVQSSSEADGEIPLTRNFIPCYRKSDNEPGMYDLVSNQFYTNSGSGTFLMGDPVHYDTASLLERRRQILLNTPHIKTVSDSVASFNTDIATDLKGLKVYFSPVQEGTGDPSPDNVRPITGWDGIEVNIDRDVHRLIPIDWKTVTYNGITREYLGNGKYHCYGTLTKAYSTDRIYFEPFTCSTENGRKIRFNNSVAMNGYTFRIYFNNDASNVEWWVFDSINRSTNNPYTTMAGKYINNFQMEFLQVGNYYDFTFQIEFTVSEAPISISFPQTIYGGYADLVSGEVVEEYNSFILDGENYKFVGESSDGVNTHGMAMVYNYIGYSGLANLPKCVATANTIYSSLLPINVTINIQGIDYNCIQTYSGTGNRYLRAIISQDELTDVSTGSAITSSINEWLSNNPTQIVYKLATPNTYTLTPETIKALKGINNIWSNANGNVEVSFYSH